jgi:hypothetical protein
MLILTEKYCLEYYYSLEFRNKAGINSRILINYLCNLDEIIDVSPLKNVYALDLSFCKGIIDVCALCNVKILNLSHCSELLMYQH